MTTISTGRRFGPNHIRSTLQAHAWLLPAGTFLVAFVIRCGRLVIGHDLDGVFEYDDGVHLFAAQLLVSGHLPYRDFLFLQPPGIALLLAPFAALGRATSDNLALVSVRVAIAAVGASNATLITVLLRRYGLWAALLGGLLYGTWSAAASAERTILLEPLLGLALLVGLILIRRATTLAVFLAGLSLGLAVTVKLWAIVDAAVLISYCARTQNIRRSAVFAAGVGAACLAVLVPFFLSAPGTMWREVVIDQLGRGRETTLAARIRMFDGVGGIVALDRRISDWMLMTAAVLVMLFLVAAIFINVKNAKRMDPAEGVLWPALALAQLLTLLAAPSFYYHYADFAAPALSLTFGLGVARIARKEPAGRRAFLRAACFLIILTFGASSVRHVTTSSDGMADEAQSFSSTHHCIWVDSPILLDLADSALTNISRGCTTWPDPGGVLLDAMHGTGQPVTPSVQANATAWQEAMVEQMSQSDGAILAGEISTQSFSMKTSDFFLRRFKLMGQAGNLTFWVLR